MKNEVKIQSMSFEMRSIIIRYSKHESISINYYDMKNILHYSSDDKEEKIEISEENEYFAIFNIFPFIYNNELNFLISLNGSACDAFVSQTYSNKYYAADISCIAHNIISILKEYKNGNILVDGHKFIDFYFELDEKIKNIIDGYNDNTRKFIDYTNIINEERKLKEEMENNCMVTVKI